MSNKYILVKEAWPEIAKLLNIPENHIGGGVTIRLMQGDVVRVDIEGLMPVKQPVNLTELTSEIERRANLT